MNEDFHYRVICGDGGLHVTELGVPLGDGGGGLPWRTVHSEKQGFSGCMATWSRLYHFSFLILCILDALASGT